MQARDIAVALVKVWGLTLLVSGARVLMGLLPIGAFAEHDVRLALMGNALNGIVALAAGLAVLLGAETIVRMLGIPGRPDADAPPSRYDVVELQSLVFGGVGVFLAVGALRDIATLLYTILRKPAWDPSNALPYLLEHRQTDLVGAVVQLIVAILLLVNRTMLANAWHRMRPMASPRDAE